jgi:hypothetical protein
VALSHPQWPLPSVSPALDQRYFCTQFACAQSRRHPGRSTADHDHLKHLLSPFAKF